MPHQKGMAAYGGTKKQYQKAARAEKRGKMPKGMHMMPDGMPMKDSDMRAMMNAGRSPATKKRPSPKRATSAKKR